MRLYIERTNPGPVKCLLWTQKRGKMARPPRVELAGGVLLQKLLTRTGASWSLGRHFDDIYCFRILVEDVTLSGVCYVESGMKCKGLKLEDSWFVVRGRVEEEVRLIIRCDSETKSAQRVMRFSIFRCVLSGVDR